MNGDIRMLQRNADLRRKQIRIRVRDLLANTTVNVGDAIGAALLDDEFMWGDGHAAKPLYDIKPLYSGPVNAPVQTSGVALCRTAAKVWHIKLQNAKLGGLRGGILRSEDDE